MAKEKNQPVHAASVNAQKPRKRKAWKDLTITDDYMFKLVMSRHQDLCKHLIEKVLGIKVRKLVNLEEEKSIRNSYDGKGIRLDVYVEDDANSRFLLEMQVKDYGDEEIARRSRYYQSTIDFDFLMAGHNYKELGDVYVIFFCPFKIFGGKRRKYTFEDTCREDSGILLGDGAKKVFLSSQGLPTDELDPDVEAFLGYMAGAVGDNDFVRGVDDEIRREKDNPNEEAVFVTYQMKLDEEREEGREEGRLEANEKTVVRRLRRLGRHIHLEGKDLQELAEDSDMSVERVLSLAKENGIVIV